MEPNFILWLMDIAETSFQHEDFMMKCKILLFQILNSANSANSCFILFRSFRFVLGQTILKLAFMWFIGVYSRYIYCTLDLNKIAGKCTSVFVCRSNFCNKWGDAFASISTRWYFLGFSHFSSFILFLLCCQLRWAFFFSSFQIMFFASHSLLYWILDMLQLLLGDRIFLYLMLKWVAP